MRLNSKGSAGLVFILSAGVMMGIGMAAMQLSFDLKNKQLLRQLNGAEGFLGAETAAWQQYRMSNGQVENATTGNMAVHAGFVANLRRYKDGNYRRFAEGPSLCGSAKFDPSPSIFKVCLGQNTPAPAPAPAEDHIIFATSTTRNAKFRSGALTGVAAADAICQQHGDSSFNPNFAGKTWKALLSTPTVHTKDRVTIAGNVVRYVRSGSAYNAQIVADAAGARTLYSDNLHRPLQYNERGDANPQIESGEDEGYEDLWTATNDNGTYSNAGGSNACSSWTSDDANDRVQVGNSYRTDGLFNDPTSGSGNGEALSSCDDLKYLICISQ